MSREFVGRKGVSLERLQSLCLVAEAGSIMAAAKGDPNRQSLFSRQIKELETALGLELLERTSVPYRLSRDGERLEGLARAFIGGVQRILDESNQRPSEVCIGAGESILQWLVLPLLSPALNSGGLRLRCQNLRSREVVEALRHRRIDLGILSSHHQAADLESRKLATYGLIAAGNPALMPAAPDARWADFNGRALAILEGPGELRHQLESLAAEERNGPQISVECTSYPQVIEVCGSGNFVGLLPGIARRAARQAGLAVATVRELRDVKFGLSLMWNPVVAANRSEVRDIIARILRSETDRPAAFG